MDTDIIDSGDDLASKTIALDHSYAKQPPRLPYPLPAVSQSQRLFPLKLINNRDEDTKNICFVNSVIQFLRKSNFSLFLTTFLRQYLSDVPCDSFSLKQNTDKSLQ